MPMEWMNKVHHRTGDEGPEGSRGMALLFNFVARWTTPVPSHSTSGTKPVPTVYEAGMNPGPVCTGGENLVPQKFDPQNVRPLADLYADWAIPARQMHLMKYNKIQFMTSIKLLQVSPPELHPQEVSRTKECKSDIPICT
jgi:hypothetical protein